MHEKSRDMILVWNEWKAMDEESGIWTRLENEERCEVEENGRQKGFGRR